MSFLQICQAGWLRLLRRMSGPPHTKLGNVFSFPPDDNWPQGAVLDLAAKTFTIGGRLYWVKNLHPQEQSAYPNSYAFEIADGHGLYSEWVIKLREVGVRTTITGDHGQLNIGALEYAGSEAGLRGSTAGRLFFDYIAGHSEFGMSLNDDQVEVAA